MSTALFLLGSRCEAHFSGTGASTSRAIAIPTFADYRVVASVPASSSSIVEDEMQGKNPLLSLPS
jgi:hypothetical protein